MGEYKLEVGELLASVGAKNEEQQREFDRFIADLDQQQHEANE